MYRLGLAHSLHVCFYFYILSLCVYFCTIYIFIIILDENIKICSRNVVVMDLLCNQGMGSVPGALGGLNLGGLDLSSMLSNPALMNMVCARSALILRAYCCFTFSAIYFSFVVQSDLFMFKSDQLLRRLDSHCFVEYLDYSSTASLCLETCTIGRHVLMLRRSFDCTFSRRLEEIVRFPLDHMDVQNSPKCMSPSISH